MKKKLNVGCSLGLNIERIPSTLKNLYGYPPFSVLNARDGDWQKRKREWISIGIKSELGRTEKEEGKAYPNQDGLTKIMKDKNGKTKIDSGLCFGEIKNYDGSNRQMIGTSIFDPVLCELFYSWFCPLDGLILDPFAGGSVRGIVASVLGYKYWGCDLRLEQIEANYEQSENMCLNPDPIWAQGDSEIRLMEEDVPYADFVFSCPPYGDLEVYSKDPSDLGNMSYENFILKMGKIVNNSIKKLKDNRFACFVVSDFRDKKGFLRNFVSDTISCFIDSGLSYYNEAILITAVGSLPVRVKRQFDSGRKLGKTHQNILVFYKGDPKNIKSNF